MKRLILILLMVLFGGGLSNAATADTQIATLSAITPSQNTDSSPLTDLAGLRVYYGTTAGSYTEPPIDFPITETGVPWSAVIPHEIPNEATVTYFYVVTAYTASGLESEYSTMSKKTFTGPPPPKPNAPVKFTIQ